MACKGGVGVELQELRPVADEGEVGRGAQEAQAEHIRDEAGEFACVTGQDGSARPAQGSAQRRAIGGCVVHVRPFWRITPPPLPLPPRIEAARIGRFQ